MAKTKKAYVKLPSFSNTDRKLMDLFIPIAEGIAKAFGQNCEVIIHYLENLNSSVIHIVNGHITGRSVGAPLTDRGLEILKNARYEKGSVFGLYEERTKDGKILRSITTIIRNNREKIIGFLCINIDLTISLYDFGKEFFQKSNTQTNNISEHFSASAQELTRDVFSQVVTHVNSLNIKFGIERNRLIVFEILKRGIFDIKGSIDLVAHEMGVSRYTIYNYIREAKNKIKINQNNNN